MNRMGAHYDVCNELSLHWSVTSQLLRRQPTSSINYCEPYERAAAEAATAAKSAGLSIPAGVRNRAKRAWLGRGTSTLSDMFLAPDSVDQIRQIAARAAETLMTEAMLRQIIQVPNEIRLAQ